MVDGAAASAESIAPLLVEEIENFVYVERVVDYKGRPVTNRSKFGGWRSASFFIRVVDYKGRRKRVAPLHHCGMLLLRSLIRCHLSGECIGKSSSSISGSGAHQSERNVFQCFVFGPTKAGNSALLNSFLGRPFAENYAPTTTQRSAANVVEQFGIFRSGSGQKSCWSWNRRR
ncbi:hypothetical protein FRX31_014443 [Thalictrum thalictroides]|uniref:Uncharacterized protein n=1 Tax=Thalictrum thalictroides TaxID=46969 RepID=A0A7J6WH56_THATH|nr:hypothetical protein FRX31_014443 [Thalictrum thalictroides]